MKLEIYRPIITNRITQGWGENKACTDGVKVYGSRGTCPKGTWKYYPSIGMKGHNGVDLAASHGEPVYHAGHFDGTMRVEKDLAGGIGVDVVSDRPVQLNDGRKVYVKLRYWHLKAPVGYDGKKVKLGEQIGLADNTGASSGDHVHFGLKVCDKHGTPKEKGNGWFGAMNLEEYADFSIDAKTKAEYLYQKAPQLSEQERKEILSQLSAAHKLLNLLWELKRRLYGRLL